MGITTRPRGVDFLRDSLSARLPLVFGGSNSPPLGPSSNAIYASGYRLLYDGYSGPLFQLQRTSDGQTMLVYPLANGDVDEASMTDFVGAGDANVTLLYDQIGTNDLPGSAQLISAGTFFRRNGHPTPYFAGTNKFSKSAPNSLPLGSSARTFAIVGEFDTFGAQSYMLSYGSSATTGNFCNFGKTAATAMLMSIKGPYVGGGVLDTNLHQYAWRYDAGEQIGNSELLIDCVAQTITISNTPTATLNTVNNYLAVGGYFLGGYYVSGYEPEVIIFDASVSLDDLCANQHAYWSI